MSLVPHNDFQRESLKASTFEEAFQQASAATKILHKEVEQRKADAKRIAQEVCILRRWLVPVSPALGLRVADNVSLQVGYYCRLGSACK